LRYHAEVRNGSCYLSGLNTQVSGFGTISLETNRPGPGREGTKIKTYYLRSAAEALGVTDDYADLSPVRQKVRHWTEALYQAVVNALEAGDSAT
jgi:hypothetical protein